MKNTTPTDCSDCLCHLPQYANHGTTCPCCEAEREMELRLAEDDQREREWLERETAMIGY
jgi:DNA-binding helix-hairpin-helix protein with protein kinase domain